MQYLTYRNGKLLTVKDIDAVCDNIKELFEAERRRNEDLVMENKHLKLERYENDEIQRLLLENEILKTKLQDSFTITPEQRKKINIWQKMHNHGKCKYPNFIYKFIETSIGDSGTCVCSRCGEELEFQFIGD